MTRVILGACDFQSHALLWCSPPTVPLASCSIAMLARRRFVVRDTREVRVSTRDPDNDVGVVLRMLESVLETLTMMLELY